MRGRRKICYSCAVAGSRRLRLAIYFSIVDFDLVSKTRGVREFCDRNLRFMILFSIVLYYWKRWSLWFAMCGRNPGCALVFSANVFLFLCACVVVVIVSEWGLHLWKFKWVPSRKYLYLQLLLWLFYILLSCFSNSCLGITI